MVLLLYNGHFKIFGAAGWDLMVSLIKRWRCLLCICGRLMFGRWLVSVPDVAGSQPLASGYEPLRMVTAPPLLQLQRLFPYPGSTRPPRPRLCSEWTHHRLVHIQLCQCPACCGNTDVIYSLLAFIRSIRRTFVITSELDGVSNSYSGCCCNGCSYCYHAYYRPSHD
jgi:hypothetical protein